MGMGQVFDENSEFLNYLQKKKIEGEAPSIPPKFEPEEEGHTELHINSMEDAYVLDLKSHTLKSPKGRAKKKPEPKTEKPKTSKKIDKLSKIEDKATPTSNLKGFLGGQFSFLFKFIGIFLIGYLALNWSAYSQIFYTWYLDTTGQQVESPLDTFTADEGDSTNIAATPFSESQIEIPPIDIEVTPPGTRVIIPRINQNVPVVNVADDKLVKRDWAGLEDDLQDALKGGVVHYPGTPWFDQSGNVVLTGHSSYYPWDPGRFKDVFALLHQLVEGDEIVVFHNQQKFKYVISKKEVVLPTEINVLGDSGDDRLTLITCTPIGTNLKRLIVTATPVEI